MGIPACSQYADAANRIRGALAAEEAVGNLRRYLTRPGGAEFDKLADRAAVNEFTARDFQAVSKLKVHVLRTAQQWLTGEGRPYVEELLSCIPADIDIWEVAPDEFGDQLGPKSPAWRLWQSIVDHQDGAGFAGKYVTAGKLLHCKRPRLIPIYDQDGIGRALGVRHRDIWEVMWCALREPDIRQSIRCAQASVSEAGELSLLRVLDIILWMSVP